MLSDCYLFSSSDKNVEKRWMETSERGNREVLVVVSEILDGSEFKRGEDGV